MATSPEEVTHAFTLSAPHLAWLILNGHKTIENRQVRLPTGWYGVHVGLAAYTSIAEELKYHKEFKMPPVLGMKRGYVHGLCKIGAAAPHSLVEGNRWAVGSFKFANIITEVVWFEEPVKARGNFNFWPLKSAQEEVRKLAKQSVWLGNRKRTNLDEALADIVKKSASDQTKRPAQEEAKAQDESGAKKQKTKRETIANPKPAQTAQPVTTDIRSFFAT